MSKLPTRLNAKVYGLYQLTVVVPVFVIMFPLFSWWFWIIRIILGLFVFVQVWYTFTSRDWKIYEVMGVTTLMNAVFVIGTLLFIHSWISYIFILLFPLSNVAMLEKIKKVNEEHEK